MRKDKKGQTNSSAVWLKNDTQKPSPTFSLAAEEREREEKQRKLEMKEKEEEFALVLTAISNCRNATRQNTCTLTLPTKSSVRTL
jgi:hypothetical protein